MANDHDFSDVASSLRAAARSLFRWIRSNLPLAFGYGFRSYGTQNLTDLSLKLLALVISGAGVLAIVQNYVRDTRVLFGVYVFFSLAVLYAMSMVIAQHQNGKSVQSLHSMRFSRWAFLLAIIAFATVTMLHLRGLLDFKSERYSYTDAAVPLAKPEDFENWRKRNVPADNTAATSINNFLGLFDQKLASINAARAANQKASLWVVSTSSPFDVDYYPFEATLNVPPGAIIENRYAFLRRASPESDLPVVHPLAFVLDKNGNQTNRVKLESLQKDDHLVVFLICRGSVSADSSFSLVTGEE